MLIFFDTEFTGLHKDTTLISIGLVADNGSDRFYAELSDFDYKQMHDDEWIKKNVFEKLHHRSHGPKTYFKDYHYGNAYAVAEMLKNWLAQFTEPIQFVSDVCHYDFVLLIDLLWDEAMHMPSCVSPVCYDVNQDIAAKYCLTDFEAFNMSREGILKDLLGLENVGIKHNALHDAEVIRLIYYAINDPSVVGSNGNELTCSKCQIRKDCDYKDEPENINGICLALKEGDQ